MRSSGAMQIRAPLEVVWELITDPVQIPRYTPSLGPVRMLAGSEGVGARRYEIAQSPRRAVVVDEVISVWEPPNRFVSTSTVGFYRVRGEYLLRPGESGDRDYRTAPDAPPMELAWSCEAALRSAGLWLLMPFVLFLPAVLMLRIGPTHDEQMARIRLAAEAAAAASKPPS